MRGTLHVRRVLRSEPEWRTPWGATATDEETLRQLRELGVPLEKGSTYTEYEQVLTQPLHTDANGRGAAQFTLSEEGCYEVVWESEETSPATRAVDTSYLKVVKPGSPEPTFFREVQGPVRVHPDAADLKPGQELPVRIILQDAPCYVLVLEETDKILRWRLLSAKHQTEAIRVPLTEEHTPAFRLTAITVKDGLAFGDWWDVIVPPVQHNLLVDIQSGKGGSYTIRTRDHQGNPIRADVNVVVVNRAALSHALRFPDPEFDRSRGPTEDPFAPTPPLPPGYPEDPRLYFPPPVQIERGNFATSYDTGHYIKERRGYQMLPIRYNWRGEFINRYLTTLPSGHIGSAPSMPAKLIAAGRINGIVYEWSYASPVRGPWQFRESEYAQLPYTRYVQQLARDAVLAQIPEDRDTAPRTLFCLPSITTDETGRATFRLPPEALRGGVLIAVACSQQNQFGWLMQAIPPQPRGESPSPAPEEPPAR